MPVPSILPARVISSLRDFTVPFIRPPTTAAAHPSVVPSNNTPSPITKLFAGGSAGTACFELDPDAADRELPLGSGAPPPADEATAEGTADAEGLLTALGISCEEVDRLLPCGGSALSDASGDSPFGAEIDDPSPWWFSLPPPAPGPRWSGDVVAVVFREEEDDEEEEE